MRPPSVFLLPILGAIRNSVLQTMCSGQNTTPLRSQRNASLSAASQLKYLHLAYFAKPVADRTVYRSIRNTRAGNLAVIGVGSGELARKMIQLASDFTSRPQVRFTGIDLFEMRGASKGALTLKQAHRFFAPFKARIQLVPGDPCTALARIANSLPDIDLVVVRGDQDLESLERAWFYLPRMLHETSVVLVEHVDAHGQPVRYDELDLNAVRAKAGARPASTRRAA